MNLSQQEAFLILSDLDNYVAKYERARKRKVTPGAMRLIQEILTTASFPSGGASQNLH